MDDELASIKRKYMSANSESFLALGERLARELGGTFKMQDGKAVLARQGAANGLPEIAGKFTGDASGNLISWNVEPVSSRPKFKDVAVRFFDREAGQVRTHSEHVGDGQVTNAIRSTAQDKAQALGIAAGRKREAQRKGGEGRVVLDLEPKAQAEALFRLSGTRPGIDGSYRIVSVTHKADRSGGATTELELRQPHGGAGEDARV
jgi:phage protein D